MAGSKGSHIVRLRIPDSGVGAARPVAGGQHVPEGDPPPGQKTAALFVILLEGLVPQGIEDRPKGVPAISVILLLLKRRLGGHGT